MYEMFSDDALRHFRNFCDASNFTKPHRNPSGAFDAKPRWASDAAPEKDHLIFSLLKVVDDLRPKGGAADQEAHTDITKQLSDLDNHLEGFMQPEAYKEAHEMIVALIADCSDLIKDAHKGMNAAIAGGEDEDRQDQPPKLSGRPERGGAPAMDAAAIASFNARFPGASRIGTVPPYGEQPTQRSRAPDNAAVNSFARMFPMAAKIGNV